MNICSTQVSSGSVQSVTNVSVSAVVTRSLHVYADDPGYCRPLKAPGSGLVGREFVILMLPRTDRPVVQ